MSYTPQYRLRAVEYHLEGHTLEVTSRIFKIGITTLKQWLKQYKAGGDLSNKPLNRGPKKLCPKALTAYVQAHPDAYQSEIAQEFNCCQSAVSRAFARLEITRKKRRSATGNKTLKK